MFEIAKTCLLLGTLLPGLAFPVWAQSYDTPPVIVSVYDDVGVSASALAQAKQKAARIFESAGVNVAWQDCSATNHVGPDALVRAGEQSSPGSVPRKTAGLGPAGRVGAPAPTWSRSNCDQFEWPTRLAVRIVADSNHSTRDVFGVAFLSAEDTGCYSDVFYDRAAELNSASNVGLSDILGGVMAHELGHLLLGSNSHVSSGIMRANWQREDLSRAARGSLLFTAEQSVRMRAKLVAARTLLAVTARPNY